MTTERTNTKSTHHNYRALLMIGSLIAIVPAIACTNKSKPTSQKSLAGEVRPAVMEVASTPAVKPASMEVVEKAQTPVKPALKPLTFKSRDYGVSFVYPWQYTFLNAKIVAKDETRHPKSDGNDGQFTLARVEIPKGFYADTDLDSAYFTLSLNEDLDEQGCAASISPDKNGEIQNETINGATFRWSEKENGGHGSASKVRNYTTFANDTCYEVEMGVKTQSDGLSRELDPDQVMRRLNAILKTVEIKQAAKTPAAPQLKSSAEPKPLEPQN